MRLVGGQLRLTQTVAWAELSNNLRCLYVIGSGQPTNPRFRFDKLNQMKEMILQNNNCFYYTKSK